MVSEAAKLTHFAAGPGRDLTDIDYTVQLTGIGGECIYNDLKAPTQVTVDMKLRFRAVAGPANRSRRGDFRYFVAVVDRDNGIMAREEFKVKVTLDGPTGNATGEEELEQVIPVTKDLPGAAFHVLVGIMMTPEELSRNRSGLNR